MTVPLVAEFSACTSAYGRLAPLPPAAAAHAGAAARARTPPAASNAVLPAKATSRPGFRMAFNTLLLMRRNAGPSPAAPQSGGRRSEDTTACRSTGRGESPRRLRGRRGGEGVREPAGTLGGGGTESGGT